MTGFVCVCVAYGRGSVLLWQRRDTLYISGFMDDVMHAHKLRQLNVTTQLIEAQPTRGAWEYPLQANGLTLTGLLFWRRGLHEHIRSQRAC